MSCKRFFVLVLLGGIFLNGLLFAEADYTFKNVCENLSKDKIVRGSFTLKQKSGKTQKSISSSGTYTLSQQDGIIWFTEKPVKSVMVMMNEKIIQEIRGQKKIMDGKQNETFKEIANVISSIFTGRFEEINNKFEINFKIDDVDGTKYYVVLIPLDKTIASYLKSVSINGICTKSKTEILNFTILQFNDDEKTYTFSDQIKHTTLTESEEQYFEK